jgi:hypothetical protein
LCCFIYDGIMPFTLSPYPAYIIGAAGVAVGLWGLLAPAGAAAYYGIPASTSRPAVSSSLTPASETTHPATQGSTSAIASKDTHPAAQSTAVSPETPPSPYVAVAAVRDIALGLAMVGLQLQDNVEGVSTLLAARGALEALDGLLVWRFGGETVRDKAIGHVVGGIVFARWAWWRFFEEK